MHSMHLFCELHMSALGGRNVSHLNHSTVEVKFHLFFLDFLLSFFLDFLRHSIDYLASEGTGTFW